jgi:hypothetical protein
MEHYVGIVAPTSGPKCHSTQLDEDWGSHSDDCPPGDHRHLICTNPKCGWTFITVTARPGKQ